MQFLWHDIRKDDREQCRKELTEEKKLLSPIQQPAAALLPNAENKRKNKKISFPPFFVVPFPPFFR